MILSVRYGIFGKLPVCLPFKLFDLIFSIWILEICCLAYKTKYFFYSLIGSSTSTNKVPVKFQDRKRHILVSKFLTHSFKLIAVVDYRFNCPCMRTHIMSWEIDAETVEKVSDFILGGLQNHCRW